MKHEFWAEFDLYGAQEKKRIIDAIVGKLPLSERWAMISDAAMRQHILAQLLATDEKCVRGTKCKDYAKGKNGLQHWYYAGNLANPREDYQEFLYKRLRWMGVILSLANHEDTVGPVLPDLSLFPKGAWALRIKFILKKPYISKDDTAFYIIDNPVKKEWVFKVPYVAPSQWKGALRSSMIRELVSQLANREINEKEFIEKRLRLFRLFGSEKDGTADFLNRAFAHRSNKTVQEVADAFERKLREEGYRKGEIEGFLGHLHFYPTFFDRIGMEVINPHDRKTGVGKNPIYFECVPAGIRGVLQLLYVPLDKIGITNDEAMMQEAKSDLEAVVQGVYAMLTKYGFGAKTSSGYGVAKVEDIKCCLKTDI